MRIEFRSLPQYMFRRQSDVYGCDDVYPPMVWLWRGLPRRQPRQWWTTSCLRSVTFRYIRECAGICGDVENECIRSSSDRGCLGDSVQFASSFVSFEFSVVVCVKLFYLSNGWWQEGWSRNVKRTAMGKEWKLFTRSSSD